MLLTMIPLQLSLTLRFISIFSLSICGWSKGFSRKKRCGKSISSFWITCSVPILNYWVSKHSKECLGFTPCASSQNRIQTLLIVIIILLISPQWWWSDAIRSSRKPSQTHCLLMEWLWIWRHAAKTSFSRDRSFLTFPRTTLHLLCPINVVRWRSSPYSSTTRSNATKNRQVSY